MKYILVIGDGMADESQMALLGKTPLEFAPTPTLDTLAPRSQVGLAQTAPQGTAPGSDQAILGILGLLNKQAPSRSALEAVGCGLSLGAEACLCRCNLVSLSEGTVFEEKRLLSHNGGGIDGKTADILGQYLLENQEFSALAERTGLGLHLGHSFRHLAAFREDVSGVSFVPPQDILGKAIRPYLPEQPEGIGELLALANRLLQAHPTNQQRREQGMEQANGIWFWSPGKGGTLPNFREKYGVSGAVVCGVPLVRGIGAAAGMTAPTIPGATGGPDTDYGAKAKAAAALLREHDFVLVHVEAPDEATHAGDMEEKCRAVSNLDRQLLAPVLEAVTEPFRLLFISDHLSFLRTRSHGAGPVPFLLFDSRKASHGPVCFSEGSGREGGSLYPAKDLMPLLLEKTVEFY